MQNQNISSFAHFVSIPSSLLSLCLSFPTTSNYFKHMFSKYSYRFCFCFSYTFTQTYLSLSTHKHTTTTTIKKLKEIEIPIFNFFFSIIKLFPSLFEILIQTKQKQNTQGNTFYSN